MINRLKEILIREGLSSGAFADEIGVQRSSLSHILNGRNNPSLDFMLKTLQRFPRINSDWLLMGKGEMYIDNNTDSKDISSDILSPSLFNNDKTGSKTISESDIPPTVSDIPKETVNEEVTLEKSEKYVSQIVIFYSDSTYQVYKPEKPA